ncbi:hypothetical protein SHIRM173S_07170 [Streptomyces hirsutus]
MESCLARVPVVALHAAAGPYPSAGRGRRRRRVRGEQAGAGRCEACIARCRPPGRDGDLARRGTPDALRLAAPTELPPAASGDGRRIPRGRCRPRGCRRTGTPTGVDALARADALGLLTWSARHGSPSAKLTGAAADLLGLLPAARQYLVRRSPTCFAPPQQRRVGRPRARPAQRPGRRRALAWDDTSGRVRRGRGNRRATRVGDAEDAQSVSSLQSQGRQLHRHGAARRRERAGTRPARRPSRARTAT